jgi:hypothetical protein
MGLLYTTEGTRRILDTLNTAFDGPGKGLDVIRKAAPVGSALRRKIEGRNWKPGQLARILRLLPTDQGKAKGARSDDETRRWFWFLNKVVGPSATFRPIRNALADAILNQDSKGAPLNIIRVSFDHVELADASNPNLVIFDAPLPGVDGGSVRHITLFTVRVPEGSKFQDDPPPKDSDDPADLVAPPWE